MGRITLIIAWGAFAAWVSWLAWQAFSHGRFPVVSRAQLLAADVAVVADVAVASDGTPLPKVKVQSVVWPNGATSTLSGKEVEIVNLPGSHGFGRAGKYVLILSGQGDGPYQMAMVPRSPLRERAGQADGLSGNGRGTGAVERDSGAGVAKR